MPWLEAIAGKNYLQNWTQKCQQAHGELFVRIYMLKITSPKYNLQNPSKWHTMMYPNLYSEEE
jgi:hypothetical protein